MNNVRVRTALLSPIFSRSKNFPGKKFGEKKPNPQSGICTSILNAEVSSITMKYAKMVLEVYRLTTNQDRRQVRRCYLKKLRGKKVKTQERKELRKKENHKLIKHSRGNRMKQKNKQNQHLCPDPCGELSWLGVPPHPPPHPPQSTQPRVQFPVRTHAWVVDSAAHLRGN